MRRNFLFAFLSGSIPLILVSQVLTVAPGIPTAWNAADTRPLIIETQDGNCIVAWLSYREASGITSIYAQRLDPKGNITWPLDGIRITQFNVSQQSFCLLSDGKDGAYIVWEDLRAGNEKVRLYAQRINGSGELLWQRDGVCISASEGKQQHPVCAVTAYQELVVCWEDTRRSAEDKDLYVQRITPDGKVLFSSGGAILCNASGTQQRPALCQDPVYGTFFVWEDFRNGKTWNLFAQRLSTGGNLDWKAGGLELLPSGSDNRQSPALIPDGYGGILVTWQAYGQGTQGNDIFHGRFKSNGEPAYIMCTSHSDENQEHPIIVKKGSDCLIAWEDNRNGQRDIYAQMVQISDGLFLWTLNGSPVAASKMDEYGPVVIANAQFNYQIFLWQQDSEGDHQFCAMKTDSYANALWDFPAIFQQQPLLPENLSATSTHDGFLLAAWSEDLGESGSIVRCNRISMSGTPFWEKGPSLRPDMNKPWAELSGMVLMTNANGEHFLVWEDRRNHSQSPDLYMQKLNIKGEPQWGPDGLPLCTASGMQSLPVLTDDGVGGMIIAWEDSRLGLDDNIFAQRVNGNGRLLWGREGIPVCTAFRSQGQLQIVSDAREGAIICWVDGRNLELSGFDIYIQRLNERGEPQWGADGKPFIELRGLQTAPSMVTDGEGGAYVAWMDNRADFSNIYLQRINAYGFHAWDYGGVRVSPAESHQRNPELIRTYVDDLYLAWEDARQGEGNDKIYIQTFTSTGIPMWSISGKMVCNTQGAQTRPMMVADVGGNLWLTWLDARYHALMDICLMVQHFDDDGSPLWEVGGQQLASRLGELSRIGLSCDDQGNAYYFWPEDGQGGSKKLYAQHTDAEGHKLLNEDGIVVGDFMHEQRSPVLGAHDGIMVLCWIDVDPGSGKFSILCQKQSQ